MGLTDRLNSWLRGEARGVTTGWPSDWLTIGGHLYPLNLNTTMPNAKQEEIPGTFEGFAEAYAGNSVIYACMAVRQLLFSEARFQFQAFNKGRPGQLFSTPELDILEHPWPGGTTGDLLSQLIVHADLAGNAFVVRRPNRLVVLRPSWVSIVLSGEMADPEAELVGYLYHPGGPHSGKDPIAYLRTEVAHFAPMKDPLARYRGMSWLTPLVREIMADSAARDTKLAFFENGAIPNAIVKNNAAMTPDNFAKWVKAFKDAEPSGGRAYKTLFLDNMTDLTVVGANLRQMDFKITQGAGETRIAAAAGVPPVIVGLSEGLQAATYSNYGQARRRLADGTGWPLWRNVAGSFETLVPARPGSRLWIDARDVPFLRDDAKDLAEIHQLEAQQIRTLTDAGFTPESVTAAVTSGDFTLLVHTGLYSVQLQPPGTITIPPEQLKATNGSPANAVGRPQG